MNKLYLVFSVIFILIAILLPSYPILAFLPTYFSTPHELKPGAQFTYYSFIFACLAEENDTVYLAKISLKYLGSNTYLLNFTLYKFNLFQIRHFAITNINIKNATIVLSINEKVNYDNSSLIRFLLPKAYEVTNISEGEKYVNFVRHGFLGSSFGIGYPVEYLGYANIYVGELEGKVLNVTKLIQLNAGEIFYFVDIHDYYMAFEISTHEPLISQIVVEEFGSMHPLLKELYNEDVMDAQILYRETNHTYLIPEVLVLNYTNIMPSDQAFLQAFISNFNGLFPLSYALVVIGLALLVIGVRRG